MKKLNLKLLGKIIFYPLGIIAMVTTVRGYLFREGEMELMPWHSVSRYEEPDYKNYKELKEYLTDEREFLQKAYEEVLVTDGGILNRYSAKSLVSPFDSNGENINLSYELVPENIKGGVLLLHGMTDSPFITKDIAQVFYEQGYYVLAMRYRYHGTFPGELAKLRWEDLIETAKFGSKMVHEKIKDIPDSKFYIAGYSTGAPVSLYYSTHELKEDRTLPNPDKLFWFAPAMGISAMAKMVGPDMILSKIPYFKKFQWLDILPEYDAGKYNSFHKTPGIELDTLIDKAKEYGVKTDQLPPIFAYTSLKDATVNETKLFEFLGAVGNERGELVVFDANRKFNEFFKKRVNYMEFLKELKSYAIKGGILILSNHENPEDDKVTLFGKNGEAMERIKSELGLSWGEFTFSLGHLAIPVAPENILYGKDSPFAKISINLRGEKNIAGVDANSLMRLRYNQFFPFMAENIKRVIDEEEI